jgi:prepilin-type N-terminal cleavage/methylation domain-containing protein
MMQIYPHNNSDKGFSLIEVIVTLILISLLGIMLVSFYQTQIAPSTTPVIMRQQGFTLDGILEKINADYQQLLVSDPNPLAALQTNINAYDYGTYTAATEFIAFDASDNEISCAVACRILKVTITIGDQSLTTIFTQ